MLLKKPHERSVGAGDFLINRLGFSIEQQKEFEDINNKHHTIMMGFDEIIGGLKNETFEIISNNEEIDASLSYKIGMYEGKKQEEIFRFLAEIRMICNEKQLGDFDDIFNEILSSKEPSDRHRPPPPPLSGREGSHRPPPPPHKIN